MPDVPPASHGFALFGPDAGVPEGGFCASAFLVLRRGDRLLAGSMAPSDRWAQEWQPNMALYGGARREALFEGWRLPATYLREGEHPEAAAYRVWTDQLGLEADPDLPQPRVVSEAAASRSTPEARHWDLVFAYELEGPPLPEDPPGHWAELAYATPAQLEAEGFVMLHGELLPLLS